MMKTAVMKRAVTTEILATSLPERWPTAKVKEMPAEKREERPEVKTAFPRTDGICQ